MQGGKSRCGRWEKGENQAHTYLSLAVHTFEHVHQQNHPFSVKHTVEAPLYPSKLRPHHPVIHHTDIPAQTRPHGQAPRGLELDADVTAGDVVAVQINMIMLLVILKQLIVAVKKKAGGWWWLSYLVVNGDCNTH